MNTGGPEDEFEALRNITRTTASPVLGYAQAKRNDLSLRQYTWLGVTLLFVAGMLHFLGPVLTPFLIAGILAYIGTPAVSWAEQHRVPRTLSTLLVLALILALVTGMMLVLAPLVHSLFSQLL